MDSPESNNRRIAKNTLVLYLRMIILMPVSLYTSRVILDALGEADYGIYNVVGGVVALFTVLSAPLSNAISRYITFELGTGNKEKLKRIFCTSVNIQVIMAIIVILVCEVVGVWFLNTKMNIPAERMASANWVLQFSIVAFAVNLISIPYNAAIIAHERMNVFAYIGILEAGLKLTVAFLIAISPIDRLIFYAALILMVAILLRLIYGIYCRLNFEEAKYSFVLDRPLLKEMFAFAGWNVIGNTAFVLNTQGINMLINIFFGVTTNAARAVVGQVDSAVYQFVNNFMTAINPQITKSYASGERDYMFSLVCRGTKFSFFITYLFIVPIVLEADTILSVWLKEVPQDAGIFLRLVLFCSLSTFLGNALYTAIISTGQIRRYQLEVTLLSIMVFPLTWVAYALGLPAYTTYIIYAVIYFLLNFIRLATLKRLMDFPVMKYLKSVYVPILACAVASFIAPGIVVYLMEPSFLRLVVVCLVSVLWSLLCIYFMGLESNEQKFFMSKAMRLLEAAGLRHR